MEHVDVGVEGYEARTSTVGVEVTRSGHLSALLYDRYGERAS